MTPNSDVNVASFTLQNNSCDTVLFLFFSLGKNTMHKRIVSLMATLYTWSRHTVLEYCCYNMHIHMYYIFCPPLILSILFGLHVEWYMTWVIMFNCAYASLICESDQAKLYLPDCLQ